MKVILLQDVKKVGNKGDIVEVSEGYGRNFLLPKKFAQEATAENLNVAKAASHASASAVEHATLGTLGTVSAAESEGKCSAKMVR